MRKLKLSNGKIFTLTPNGVQDIGTQYTYIFKDDDNEGFEAIESYFINENNVKSVYILDSEGEIKHSIYGYTQYKTMSKYSDYVISQEEVNVGTIDNPNYQIVDVTGDAYAVSMAKPDLEKKVEELQEIIDALVEDQLTDDTIDTDTTDNTETESTDTESTDAESSNTEASETTSDDTETSDTITETEA